jgi:hypothetical protein
MRRRHVVRRPWWCGPTVDSASRVDRSTGGSPWQLCESAALARRSLLASPTRLLAMLIARERGARSAYVLGQHNHTRLRSSHACAGVALMAPLMYHSPHCVLASTAPARTVPHVWSPCSLHMPRLQRWRPCGVARHEDDNTRVCHVWCGELCPCP